MSTNDSGPGGFGKITRGLSDLFNFLSELDETKLPSRGRHEKNGMVIEYSYGRRTLGEAAHGADADAPAARATPPRRRAAQPSPLEVLEPVTDTFDEPAEVLLLFELPGAREQDIRCLLEGDILLLEARAGQRLYRKEVLIEAKLAAGPPERSLRNGVLEVRLKKQG